MFLAINHATGTLNCDNLIVILHLVYVLVESPVQLLQWVSVYSLQPHYQLNTWFTRNQQWAQTA